MLRLASKAPTRLHGPIIDGGSVLRPRAPGQAGQSMPHLKRLGLLALVPQSSVKGW